MHAATTLASFSVLSVCLITQLSRIAWGWRGAAAQGGWSPLVQTNIPNDKSNLNAGPLPDGRLYLVHNPVTPGQTVGARSLRSDDGAGARLAASALPTGSTSVT
jgi:hypothetical protein